MDDAVDDAPLRTHRTLDTDDADSFRAAASKLLTPHRITLGSTRTAGEFHGDVRSTRVGDVGVFYLAQGAAVDVDISEPIDYYDVIFALSGSSAITSRDSGRGVIDAGHGAVLSPGMRARMTMSDDYGQLHLRIERTTLDRRLDAVLGRPSGAVTVFDVPLDLGAPSVASWFQFLRLGLRDLDTAGGIAAHPLAAASWQDHLLTGLLVSQANSYAGALADRAAGRPARRVLQAVLDYIEEHIDEPMSMADLAGVAGMSTRSLQRAFRDELSTSPTAHVQNLRLDRVHEQLTATDSGEASVTDVAYRWGFTHLSRFAAAYRARFGEPPSETVKKSRSETAWREVRR
ncbi:AraC family transcriptional regulator [Gordonia sp. TBRC 11910]|uniref:AraC family transcriptional regulator n=1 Tax=Gordonia asplenii TaxID=2725283 RepID=A0A848KPV3_9ACTN|nr:AraC family transcriptional regulator [Gordonia asplenii]NMO00706.1 AraC family transcriptional regulator [Gordonia asplenii]